MRSLTSLDDHDNDADSKSNDEIFTTAPTLNKENIQQQQNDNKTDYDNRTNGDSSVKEESEADERSFSSKKGYFGGKPIFPILKPVNI